MEKKNKAMKRVNDSKKRNLLNFFRKLFKLGMGKLSIEHSTPLALLTGHAAILLYNVLGLSSQIVYIINGYLKMEQVEINNCFERL